MFNIGTVSRITNLLQATLRVWERRYHFPKSTRTKGGHRLYSQEEVFRLQWVKTRIDEGMQVSKAIQALREAEERDTFHAMPNGNSTQARQLPEGIALEQLQKRLLAALVTRDLDEAGLVMGEAQALYPLEEIVPEIISHTLQEIGQAWEAGYTDVATEHLATNFLRQLLLAWMRVGPPTYGVNPVLLACAPGELHETSLLMLGVLLRRLRWPTHYLGQAVPLPDLSIFVEDMAPPVVVLVAMREESALALAQWPNWLPKAIENQTPAIYFGGRAYVEQPELLKQTEGFYLGDTLQEGVQKLNDRLHRLLPLMR